MIAITWRRLLLAYAIPMAALAIGMVWGFLELDQERAERRDFVDRTLYLSALSEFHLCEAINRDRALDRQTLSQSVEAARRAVLPPERESARQEAIRRLEADIARRSDLPCGVEPKSPAGQEERPIPRTLPGVQTTPSG